MTTLALSQRGNLGLWGISWGQEGTENPKALHHTTDNASPSLGIILHYVCEYLWKAVCGVPVFQNASLTQHLSEDQSKHISLDSQENPSTLSVFIGCAVCRTLATQITKSRAEFRDRTLSSHFLTSNWGYFPHKWYTPEKLFPPEGFYWCDLGFYRGMYNQVQPVP